MFPALSLRPILWFDAATCLAMGALLAVAAGPLSAIFGLPLIFLREAGFFLLIFALFVGWVATRSNPASGARLVAGANIAWAVASIALLATPWTSPTILGVAFVAVQAGAVSIIALVQLRASRLAQLPA